MLGAPRSTHLHRFSVPPGILAMLDSRLLLAILTLLVTPALAGAQLIAIDPGHGGSDPGAVGCGLEEADINLDVGGRLRTLLEAAGLSVFMIRESDVAVGLSNRSSMANGAGAFRYVSIHANSNAGTPATGTETFAITGAGPQALDLRDRIQREMVATWGLRDRGGKVANFSVLRNTTMPAALSEMAFVNNCGTDARLLGDASERQRMAEAHSRAILAHLGMVVPPTGEGTLIGVVFEDVGLGLEDTTRRVADATVSVAGMDVVSEGRTGAFSFRVPAGSQTITVNHPDFVEGSRTCEVMSSSDTWCSIGIVRRGAEADAGPEEDASVPDVGVADAGTTDSGIDTGESLDATPEPDASPDADLRPRSTGCATSAPGGGGGVTLLFLVGLLFWRRRLMFPVVAALVVLVGCAETQESVGSLESALELECAVDVAETSAAPVGFVAGARIEGAFDSADLAPVGGHVAVSSERMSVLSVVALESGEPRELARGQRVGMAPRWSQDGRSVGFRSPDQTDTAVPTNWVTLEGQSAVPESPRVHCFVDSQGRIVLASGTSRRVIAPPGDRYFSPRLSPDARLVAFAGASTGLYVFDSQTGRIVSLGLGSNPRFSPDGSWLVFERTLDDGHTFTSASLWLTDLRTPALTTRSVSVPDAFASSPSVDAEGRLAYLSGSPAEGRVLVVGAISLP